MMDVPLNSKTLADMVRERIGPGSTVMADKHPYTRASKSGGTTTIIMLARTVPNCPITYPQHLEYGRPSMVHRIRHYNTGPIMPRSMAWSASTNDIMESTMGGARGTMQGS